MSERHVHVGSVELCYEAFGDEGDPLVLLVMGLGLDLVWWHEELCSAIAERGFRVVRFDNRDVGRSTVFSGPGPGVLGVVRRRAPVTYSIEDMADDAAGLIAALDPRGAHVVGISLGAFIAQSLAIRAPGCVLSLVSVMGRPGDGRSGRVSKRMVLEFLRPRSRDPVEGTVRGFRRIGSEGRTAADDEDVRTRVRLSDARSRGDGSGGGRQLAAIYAERDRTAGLRGLDVPALVLHGRRDRLVLPSGGEATAAAIPGAELLLLDGVGHDLPRRIWPTLVDGIARNANR